MGLIPKIFIKEGVQATQAAKEAVANVERTVRREVIGTDKLVRNPASDCFEKKAYMETEEFWHQPQNMANYARGLYLTEGVEAVAKNVQETRHNVNRIIEKTDVLERGFEIDPDICRTKPAHVTYYERDLATGAGREVELLNGKPYKHAEWKPDGAGVIRSEVHINPKTGEPLPEKSHYVPAGYLENTEYHYSKDGKKVLSYTQEYSDGTKIIDELADDGKSVRLTKTFDKNGNLVSLTTDEKHITFHEGTKKPYIITLSKPNEQGFMEPYTTQVFDINGNLVM